MFRKLVTNLPFSPSLINQLGFYSKRLRGEQATRKIGLIFTALALVMQSVTFLAPAEATLAASANDIIYNGNGQTKTGILNAYLNNRDQLGRTDIQKIFNYYGINSTSIRNSSVVSIYSSTANNYWSTGRAARGYGGEIAKQVPGGPRIYARTLHGWAVNKNWRALEVNTSQGKRWILLDCGNIVTKESPPPAPKPVPPPQKIVRCSSLSMSVANGIRLTKPTTVKVRGNASGSNLVPGELIDMTYELINRTSGARVGSAQLANGVPFKGSTAQDPTLRNFTVNTNGSYYIRLSVHYNENNVRKLGSGSGTGSCIKYLYLSVPVTPDPTPCPLDPSIPITDAKCKPCPYNPDITESDDKCVPCPYDSSIGKDDPKCIPCEENKQDPDGNDLSCLELHKRARNITQQIDNANGTVANAGDTIEYTLSVTNTSKETRKDFVIEENMEDVMEYADIIDASGAKFSETPIKMLSWDPTDIKPNETIYRTILIKIKSPIPATPASSSDPSTFDMKLSNIYGDTVVIDLPPHPIKTVETVVTTLPSTGLGSNIFIGSVLLAVVTYFYYRSKLMTKEVGLVRQQFNYGMGV